MGWLLINRETKAAALCKGHTAMHTAHGGVWHAAGHPGKKDTVAIERKAEQGCPSQPGSSTRHCLRQHSKCHKMSHLSWIAVCSAGSECAGIYYLVLA